MKSEFDLENPEIAEILGAFIGDGWIEKRGSAWYICGNPEEDKEYYDDFLAPLFSKHFISVKPRHFTYWGVYGIVTYRTEIIKKALASGFHAGDKARTVTIPDEIMNSENLDVKTAVLRGIFDADGTFYAIRKTGKYDSVWSQTHHAQPRLTLSSASQGLMRQISTLLDEIGILYCVSVVPAGFCSGRNHNTTYRLWINRCESIFRWFEVIRTSNPRLTSRYEVWKRLGYLPPYTTHSYRKALLEAIT